MMVYLPDYVFHLINNKMTTSLAEFLILESAAHTHFHPPVESKDSLLVRQNMKPLYIHT